MNIADMIGKRVSAWAVQCEILEDRILCKGTNTPTLEYFEPDWEAEVDKVIGARVTETSVTKLTPWFKDSVNIDSTPLALLSEEYGSRMKTCTFVLGHGRGKVYMVCSEDDLTISCLLYTSPSPRD